MQTPINESQPESIKLTDEELVAALQEQISLLIGYCKSYDHGNKSMALPMSSTLRNLFHSSKRKGGGVGLLSQLSILEKIKWQDFSSPHSVEPYIHIHCPRPNSIKENTFTEWWQSPVANSIKYGTFSRSGLVLFMADKEGSHVDPSLPQNYKALRDGSFFSNMMAFNGMNTKKYIKDINRACIRTIAHETITTLMKSCPEIFNGQEYTCLDQHKLCGTSDCRRIYGIELSSEKPQQKDKKAGIGMIKAVINELYKSNQ